MNLQIPISVGELLDKITILQLKNDHINNEYVKKELYDLIVIAKENNVYDQEDLNSLKLVNKLLWETEDKLREHEQKWIFNEEFISLARMVYTLNDKRSELKKHINIKTNSKYQEIKVFDKYL